MELGCKFVDVEVILPSAPYLVIYIVYLLILVLGGRLQ